MKYRKFFPLVFFLVFFSAILITGCGEKPTVQFGSFEECDGSIERMAAALGKKKAERLEDSLHTFSYFFEDECNSSTHALCLILSGKNADEIIRFGEELERKFEPPY